MPNKDKKGTMKNVEQDKKKTGKDELNMEDLDKVSGGGGNYNPQNPDDGTGPKHHAE